MLIKTMNRDKRLTIWRSTSRISCSNRLHSSRRSPSVWNERTPISSAYQSPLCRTREEIRARAQSTENKTALRPAYIPSLIKINLFVVNLMCVFILIVYFFYYRVLFYSLFFHTRLYSNYIYIYILFWKLSKNFLYHHDLNASLLKSLR